MTIETVKIGSTDYVFDTLDPEIKQLLVLSAEWTKESKRLSRDLLRNKAAINDISRQIEDKVKEDKVDRQYVSTISDDGIELVDFK